MSGWDMRELRPAITKIAKDFVVEARYQAVYAMLDGVSTYAPVSSDKPEWKTALSGNLLGNTMVTIGAPTEATNDTVDPLRTKALFNGISVLKKAKGFETVWVQNNTEYNLQAEHEGWFFTPAYHYWDKSFNEVENAMMRMK